MNKIKAWIHGYSGRMGYELLEAFKSETQYFDLLGGSAEHLIGFYESQEIRAKINCNLYDILPNVDLIIDFSSPEGNEYLQEQFSKITAEKRIGVLIATTGLFESTIEKWKNLAQHNKLSVLFAPNTSLGVLLTLKSALNLSSILKPKGFDIEILESHHRNKADAPSGTAKFIAETIAKQHDLNTVYSRTSKRKHEELGVSSLRGGAVFGEHSIHFLGDFEEIVITHKAISRRLFANGALVLGRWLINQSEGVFSLLDVDLNITMTSA
ncbi:MAG: 4-hydroxy-tetrahydrodipicolinate reductase [Oligoflexales bacterium]|nr:4-hydroxy-tetrahydrodipicolinate reductase [Oligoflexales bacterium]